MVGTRRAIRTGAYLAPAAVPLAKFIDNESGTGGPDMAIRYAQGEARAVDTETGEYLVTKFWHYQHPTRDYSLYTADGQKIFTATVKQKAIDLSGDGRVGMYKVDVLRIAEFLSDGSCSFMADENSPIADKFSRFLRVFLLDHPGMQGSLEIEFNLENGEIE